MMGEDVTRIIINTDDLDKVIELMEENGIDYEEV